MVRHKSEPRRVSESVPTPIALNAELHNYIHQQQQQQQHYAQQQQQQQQQQMQQMQAQQLQQHQQQQQLMPQHQQQQQQPSFHTSMSPYLTPLTPLAFPSSPPSSSSAGAYLEPAPLQNDPFSFTLDTMTGDTMTHATVSNMSQASAVLRARQLRTQAMAEREESERRAKRAAAQGAAAAAGGAGGHLSTSGGGQYPGGGADGSNPAEGGDGSRPAKRPRQQASASSSSTPSEPLPAPASEAQYEVEKLLGKRVRLLPRKSLKRLKVVDEDGLTAEQVCTRHLEELKEEEEERISMFHDTAKSGHKMANAAAGGRGAASANGSSADTVPLPLYALVNPTLQLPIIEYRIRWKGYTAADDSYEPSWNIHHAMIDEYETERREQERLKRLVAYGASSSAIAAAGRNIGSSSNKSSKNSTLSHSTVDYDVQHPTRSDLDAKVLAALKKQQPAAQVGRHKAGAAAAAPAAHAAPQASASSRPTHHGLPPSSAASSNVAASAAYHSPSLSSTNRSPMAPPSSGNSPYGTPYSPFLNANINSNTSSPVSSASPNQHPNSGNVDRRRYPAPTFTAPPPSPPHHHQLHHQYQQQQQQQQSQPRYTSPAAAFQSQVAAAAAKANRSSNAQPQTHSPAGGHTASYPPHAPMPPLPAAARSKANPAAMQRPREFASLFASQSIPISSHQSQLNYPPPSSALPTSDGNLKKRKF